MTIVVIGVDAVLQIHQNQIALYGGDASVRDAGLLASAVAMAEAAFGGQFVHDFPHGMAAAYLSTSYPTTPLWTATSGPASRRRSRSSSSTACDPLPTRPPATK